MVTLIIIAAQTARNMVSAVSIVLVSYRLYYVVNCYFAGYAELVNINGVTVTVNYKAALFCWPQLGQFV